MGAEEPSMTMGYIFQHVDLQNGLKKQKSEIPYTLVLPKEKDMPIDERIRKAEECLKQGQNRPKKNCEVYKAHF